jgi:hypothetical protein
MLAALIDAKEAVAKLIERKSISAEALDKRGNGVLHLAVKSGNKSACEKRKILSVRFCCETTQESIPSIGALIVIHRL